MSGGSPLGNWKDQWRYALTLISDRRSDDPKKARRAQAGIDSIVKRLSLLSGRSEDDIRNSLEDSAKMESNPIKESELRKQIREMLEGAPGGETFEPKNKAINANAQVDKTASETDPTKTDFVPQDRAELNAAIKNIVRDLPNEDVSAVYKATVNAKDEAMKNDDSKSPVKTKEQEEETQAEAKIRKLVRTQLKEAMGIEEDAYDDVVSAEDLNDDEDEEEHEKRKFSTMSDVGGSTFEDIANEMGLSVAGAKQLVDKSMKKAQYLASMHNDDLDILILTAMKDYINYLESSGELTTADVQLIADHPDIAAELEGFREFLHKYIKRHRRENEDELGMENEV